jgi:predicted RNase H-like nuclease (RuvC/YqgF family)
MEGSYGVAMRGQAEVVALPIEPVADLQQAEYFLTLLDNQKAKVCEQLETQLDTVARHERDGHDHEVRRSRRRIDALTSELRMIDQMRQRLRVRLGLPTLARPETG